jgi:hypothetical protein
MTYKIARKSNCAWVEYRKSSTQTISLGSIITFDIKNTTGGDSVSINGSTGVVTLSSSKRYWIQASIAINKSSNGDYQIDWEKSDGTALSTTDGNFPAYSRRVSDVLGYPFYNSSYVASLLTDNPSIDYRLKVTDCPANSTVLLETHLFIMELE